MINNMKCFFIILFILFLFNQCTWEEVLAKNNLLPKRIRFLFSNTFSVLPYLSYKSSGQFWSIWRLPKTPFLIISPFFNPLSSSPAEWSNFQNYAFSSSIGWIKAKFFFPPKLGWEDHLPSSFIPNTKR